MDTKSMTRKEFVTLTFTLIGSAAAACSSSSSSNDGGTGGSFGSGGNGSGGITGTGGAGGSATCADPLPESMVADDTGHMHDVTVPAATLNATTAQTITTGPVIEATITVTPHMHDVLFTVANLGILKGGGSVTVTSLPADGHMHMFMVSCGAAAGTGGSSGGAGSTGAAGSAGAAGSPGAAGA
jgi:hypothetical protein